MSEQVNHPAHYNQGGIECIDAIEAALGSSGFIGFLRGQVIKYNWRIGLKGSATEDSKKAAWYQARLTLTLHRNEYGTDPVDASGQGSV